MQIFRYRFSSRFEDSIPIVSVVVPGQGQFVHDEGILHW